MTPDVQFEFLRHSFGHLIWRRYLAFLLVVFSSTFLNWYILCIYCRLPDTADQSNCECRKEGGGEGGGEGAGAEEDTPLLVRLSPTALHTYEVPVSSVNCFLAILLQTDASQRWKMSHTNIRIIKILSDMKILVKQPPEVWKIIDNIA
jgi:hypothetical protein